MPSYCVQSMYHIAFTRARYRTVYLHRHHMQEPAAMTKCMSMQESQVLVATFVMQIHNPVVE